MDNVVYENIEICKSCGGICCKNGGCQYSPVDFENLQIDYLLKKLEEGNISIVSIQKFVNVKDRKIANNILYLKARNTNRPVVDLISFRTTCSMLLEDGCKYDFEHRPSGGKSLIPMPNHKCYRSVEPIEYLEMWKPYQKVLTRLVKRLTGKTVDEKVSEDMYRMFISVLTQDYKDASLVDVALFVDSIESYIAAFPREYDQALLDTYFSSKKGNLARVRKNDRFSK